MALQERDREAAQKPMAALVDRYHLAEVTCTDSLGEAHRQLACEPPGEWAWMWQCSGGFTKDEPQGLKRLTASCEDGVAIVRSHVSTHHGANGRVDVSHRHEVRACELGDTELFGRQCHR